MRHRIARAGDWRSHGQRLTRWLACFASPPKRWDGTHRLLAYVALGATAFAIGMHGWRATGIGATVLETDSAQAELKRRVEDARATVARLPALKEAARKGRALPETASRVPTAHWQAISTLAAAAGMTLRSLEPGTQIADDVRGARLLRLAAHGDFAAFVAFLEGLPTLPSLTVPAELRVERANEGITVDATLRVYDALPADPQPAVASTRQSDAGPGRFADPFVAAGAGQGADAGAFRLVGLMHEPVSARGIAVIETGQGAGVYVPGQEVGAERIVSIDARGVTLASRGQRRVVTLAKEGVS